MQKLKYIKWTKTTKTNSKLKVEYNTSWEDKRTKTKSVYATEAQKKNSVEVAEGKEKRELHTCKLEQVESVVGRHNYDTQME